MSHCNPFQIFAQVCRFDYKIIRKTGEASLFHRRRVKDVKSPIDGGRWPSENSTITRIILCNELYFFFYSDTRVILLFKINKKLFGGFIFRYPFVRVKFSRALMYSLCLTEVINIKYVRRIATGRNWFKSYCNLTKISQSIQITPNSNIPCNLSCWPNWWLIF